jgi:hypothetical protein
MTRLYSIASPTFGNAGALGRALPGLLGALAFGFTFLAAAALLRSPELITLGHEIRKRLARRAGRPPEA